MNLLLSHVSRIIHVHLVRVIQVQILYSEYTVEIWNLKIISPPNWKLRQRKIPSEKIGDSTSLPNSVSLGCTEAAQSIRGQCWFSPNPSIQHVSNNCRGLTNVSCARLIRSIRVCDIISNILIVMWIVNNHCLLRIYMFYTMYVGMCKRDMTI